MLVKSKGNLGEGEILFHLARYMCKHNSSFPVCCLAKAEDLTLGNLVENWVMAEVSLRAAASVGFHERVILPYPSFLGGGFLQ